MSLFLWENGLESNYQLLTSFFGWLSVINFCGVVFTFLSLTLLKPVTLTLHAKMFGIDQDQLEMLYLKTLAYYKLLVIVFMFSPYLALRLMAG